MTQNWLGATALDLFRKIEKDKKDITDVNTVYLSKLLCGILIIEKRIEARFFKIPWHPKITLFWIRPILQRKNRMNWRNYQ